MKRLLLLLALAAALPVYAQETIKIGLVTALSGQSARAGEAITRGLQVAIDEINAKGGVLKKKLELVRRDDEATPAKGVIAATAVGGPELASRSDDGSSVPLPRPRPKIVRAIAAPSTAASSTATPATPAQTTAAHAAPRPAAAKPDTKTDAKTDAKKK